MTVVDVRPSVRASPGLVRVAAVGLGERAAWMLRLMSEASDAFRLVAVVDPDEPAARQRISEGGIRCADRLAWSPDLDAFLTRGADDIDAVVVGTRCNLHAQIAAKLAELGLPLFLEKPVAITWAQLDALRRAFEGRDDRVVVSFPLRRTPLFESALEIVNSGRLGAVNQIQAVNYVPYGNVYVDKWYRDYELNGGLWLQKATHDFDYIHALAASQPVEVTAMHSRVVWRDPVRHQDAGSAIVRYLDGAHAAYSQNFLSRRTAASRGATVTGEDATLRFDWYTKKLHVIEHQNDRVDTVEVNAEGGHGGGDQNLAQNFLDVVLGRTPSLTPLSAGLLSAATCLAARDAAHRGAAQPIPPQSDRQAFDAAAAADTRHIEPPTD